MLKTAKPARSPFARRQRQRATLRVRRFTLQEQRRFREEWQQWCKQRRALGLTPPPSRRRFFPNEWNRWIRHEVELWQLLPGLEAAYQETVRLAVERHSQTRHPIVDPVQLMYRALDLYREGVFAGPLVQEPRQDSVDASSEGRAERALDIQQTCPDCGVGIGDSHQPGCDIELCPFCGVQMLQDECCYAFFGLNGETLEQDHPEIYAHGLPEDMQQTYEAYLRPHRLPWDGVWPGVRECREYGLWCKWTAGGWRKCDPGDPDATEDLNELKRRASWDKKHKRFVLNT